MPVFHTTGLDGYIAGIDRMASQLEEAVNGAARPLFDRVVEDTREAARAQGWTEDEVQQIQHWQDENSTYVGVVGPFATEAARREYGDAETPPSLVIRKPIVTSRKHYSEQFSADLMRRLGL